VQEQQPSRETASSSTGKLEISHLHQPFLLHYDPFSFCVLYYSCQCLQLDSVFDHRRNTGTTSTPRHQSRRRHLSTHNSIVNHHSLLAARFRQRWETIAHHAAKVGAIKSDSRAISLTTMASQAPLAMVCMSPFLPTVSGKLWPICYNTWKM
jgi:hypothetical protein